MGEMNFKEIYQLFDELCTNLAGKNNSKCICINSFLHIKGVVY